MRLGKWYSVKIQISLSKKLAICRSLHRNSLYYRVIFRPTVLRKRKQPSKL